MHHGITVVVDKDDVAVQRRQGIQEGGRMLGKGGCLTQMDMPDQAEVIPAVGNRQPLEERAVEHTLRQGCLHDAQGQGRLVRIARGDRGRDVAQVVEYREHIRVDRERTMFFHHTHDQVERIGPLRAEFAAGAAGHAFLQDPGFQSLAQEPDLPASLSPVVVAVVATFQTNAAPIATRRIPHRASLSAVYQARILIRSGGACASGIHG